MLAYLVDRNGALCHASEISEVIFEEGDLNNYYYHKLRSDLLKTFSDLGLSDCITVSRGSLAINKEMVDCDYYDYLSGKNSTKPEEYMSQYSFSEYRLNNLDE